MLLGPLDREECRRLLSSVQIGRVVISLGAVPAVFPVNFVLDGEDIVFLTAPGAKLRAALDRTVVAFEVDQVDEARRSGWSVMAVGRSRGSEDLADVRAAHGLGVVPPTAGGQNRVVRIRVELLTGRQFASPVVGEAPGHGSDAETGGPSDAETGGDARDARDGS